MSNNLAHKETTRDGQLMTVDYAARSPAKCTAWGARLARLMFLVSLGVFGVTVLVQAIQICGLQYGPDWAHGASMILQPLRGFSITFFGVTILLCVMRRYRCTRAYASIFIAFLALVVQGLLVLVY